MKRLGKGGILMADERIDIPDFLSITPYSDDNDGISLYASGLRIGVPNVQPTYAGIVAYGLSCEYTAGTPSGQRFYTMYVREKKTNKIVHYWGPGNTGVSSDHPAYDSSQSNHPAALQPPTCSSGTYDETLQIIYSLTPNTTYTVTVTFYRSKEIIETCGTGYGEYIDQSFGYTYGDWLASPATVEFTTTSTTCDWGETCDATQSGDCGESCNESCGICEIEESIDCNNCTLCMFCMDCESNSQCRCSSTQYSNFSYLEVCGYTNTYDITEEHNQYNSIYINISFLSYCYLECGSYQLDCGMGPFMGYRIIGAFKVYLRKKGTTDWVDFGGYTGWCKVFAYGLNAAGWNWICWGLEPSTTYEIKVETYNWDMSSNSVGSVNATRYSEATTLAYPVTASVTGATGNSLKVTISNLSSNYIYLREYRFYTYSGTLNTLRGTAYDQTTGNKEFSYWVTGLNPNTTYYILIQMYRSGTEELLDQVTCSGKTNQPFEWDAPKVQGQPIKVTAVEWNRLVDYVNAAKGTTISHVSSGAKITATAFNAVANAVGYNTVSKSTKISAALFNELRDKYNSG